MAATHRQPALSIPPVAWSPEREARGAAPDRGTYRCPERECVVASADLRAMVAHVRAHREPEPAGHDGGRIREGTARILARLGLDARPPDSPGSAAALARVAASPARRAAVAVLLRDHARRSDREVAAEAGTCAMTAWAVRHELEDAGLIAAWRGTGGRRARNGPGRRARAALLRDHARPDGAVAAEAGSSPATAWAVRHELEAAGEISVFRAPPPGRGTKRRQPPPAVAVTAGLATAAGTAPQPAAVNGRPCACGCSELIVPGPWQQQRRFATDQCRKRVQRRDERARLRELTAAAEPSDRSELPVTSAAAVTSAARCLATVA